MSVLIEELVVRLLVISFLWLILMMLVWFFSMVVSCLFDRLVMMIWLLLCRLRVR